MTAGELQLPSLDIDPFLSATLWALERSFVTVIYGPDARAATSVHARTLLESIVAVDDAPPAFLATASGLGVVLAMPDAGQLESLDRDAFHPTTSWFLVPSPISTVDREFQDAWVWAHQRPSLSRDAPLPVADTWRGLLSEIEVWALTVRAGRGERAAALRHASLRVLSKVPM